MMKLADYLTLSRIILTPVCLFFLFIPMEHKEIYAAAIFIVAALTDGLDGYVARRRKESSDFGKSFDPIADKILIGGALYSLFMLGKVSGWVVAVILAREILITVFALQSAEERAVGGSGNLGQGEDFFPNHCHYHDHSFGAGCADCALYCGLLYRFFGP